jgi:2-dehydropantoate 2-reductase
MNQPWFILGAGAMGTLIHHLCREHKVDSHLLHHGEEEQSRFLNAGTRTTEFAALPLSSIPQGSIQRLMLTTKAASLDAAYRLVTPWLDEESTVLALANGLGWEAALNNHAIARGVSTAAAFRTAYDQVSMVTAGATLIGLPSSVAPPPDWFVDSLAKLPNWSWDEQISEAIHRKFCINCVINSLTALNRCRNGELITNTVERNAMNSLCAEVEPAMRALDLWSGPSTLLEEALKVCEATSGNQSSMLQDVLAGRATENEYLGVELLRRAALEEISLP